MIFAMMFVMMILMIDSTVKTDELRDYERKEREARMFQNLALSLPCKNCNNKELINALNSTAPASGDVAPR